MALEIHPFERNGLGIAPFRFAGFEEKVLVHPGANGYVQPAGTCDYCGQGIRYCCHIASSDGKRFIVGQDCVRKLNREDNRMLNALEREIAKHNMAKKEAARQKRWEDACKRRDAALEEERQKNGGKTNAEIAAEERKKAEDAKRAEWSVKNAWIIDVLKEYPCGDFVDSMIQRLETGPYLGLSNKCIGIIREMWCKKVGGRMGSKAYAKALDEFYSKADVDVQSA